MTKQTKPENLGIFGFVQYNASLGNRIKDRESKIKQKKHLIHKYQAQIRWIRPMGSFNGDGMIRNAEAGDAPIINRVLPDWRGSSFLDFTTSRVFQHHFAETCLVSENKGKVNGFLIGLMPTMGGARGDRSSYKKSIT